MAIPMETRLMTAYRKIFVLVSVLAAAAGCQPSRTGLKLPPTEPRVAHVAPPVVKPAPRPVAPPKPIVKPEPRQVVVTLPAGRSVQGRPITATVVGTGSQCVLVIGGIHGNEPASATLCRQLLAYLRGHTELLHGLKVIVVPAANPDGLAANTRGNARGVDVNRNFATGNYRSTARHGTDAMSQPEARYLRGIIDRYRPARILSVHQPLACIDYDGPGLALATKIAKASGLPVKKLGARAGSLGSYAGVENHIPTITVELPGDASKASAEKVWARYGNAMMVGINHRDAAPTADNTAK